MLGSNTSRLVPVSQRGTSEPESHILLRRDVLDRYVRPVSFPQPSPGLANTEENEADTEIPAPRESDVGSNTSRLGSASTSQDIYRTAFPRAPRQPIDLEGNAPVDPEFEYLSFSIYIITPKCITPQIRWRVPRASEMNWMHRHFPLLIGISNH